MGWWFTQSNDILGFLKGDDVMIGHQNMGGYVTSGNTLMYPQTAQVPQGYYPQINTIQQQSNPAQNARPMNGLQQVTQQVQQMPLIPARMTTGLDDIRPNELPSDGTVSLFMQSDYSAVYAKAVNAQGTIDTVRYVPERPAQTEQPINNGFSSIEQRLDRIEKLLSKRNKTRYHKPVNQEGDAQNE